MKRWSWWWCWCCGADGHDYDDDALPPLFPSTPWQSTGKQKPWVEGWTQNFISGLRVIQKFFNNLQDNQIEQSTVETDSDTSKIVPISDALVLKFESFELGTGWESRQLSIFGIELEVLFGKDEAKNSISRRELGINGVRGERRCKSNENQENEFEKIQIYEESRRKKGSNNHTLSLESEFLPRNQRNPLQIHPFFSSGSSKLKIRNRSIESYNKFNKSASYWRKKTSFMTNTLNIRAETNSIIRNKSWENSSVSIIKPVSLISITNLSVSLNKLQWKLKPSKLCSWIWSTNLSKFKTKSQKSRSLIELPPPQIVNYREKLPISPLIEPLFLAFFRIIIASETKPRNKFENSREERS